MYLGRGFHSFLQSANHPGSAKRACLPGLMFDPENTSNWTQESHSQVQTTAPTSGHPVPWLCFQDDLQLPPMLSFRHSWCCFFFFVFPKEVKWPSQVFLSVPPPTVCSPWRPQNPLGWLLAMLQDPAGTKQGALTPLFCGTQAVSNVRAGFSLWSWKHHQSLSQSLAEHILGKGNTWSEMKWRILGTWAHGVSLSASFDGISVFLECIHLEWGWEVLLSKY